MALRLFDNHGRTVTENLRHARSDFVGIVSDANDGVGAHLFGMFHHEPIGIHSSSFAEFRVQRDVTSPKGLQSGADVADQTARANNDSAYETQVALDSIPGEIERSSNKLTVKVGHAR